MERLHALVSGRVQGVYFRASTQEVGAGLGVVGWVRNLPDGRVELLAEGRRDQLDALLEYVKRGPPMAQVARIEYEWLAAEGGLGSSFGVRR